MTKFMVEYYDDESRSRVKVLTFDEAITRMATVDRDKIISMKLGSVKKLKSVKEIK